MRREGRRVGRRLERAGVRPAGGDRRPRPARANVAEVGAVRGGADVAAALRVPPPQAGRRARDGHLAGGRQEEEACGASTGDRIEEEVGVSAKQNNGADFKKNKNKKNEKKRRRKAGIGGSQPPQEKG